jgi:hypothetical protein
MTHGDVLDSIEETIDHLRLTLSVREDTGEARLMVNLMRAAVCLREARKREA